MTRPGLWPSQWHGRAARAESPWATLAHECSRSSHAGPTVSEGELQLGQSVPRRTSVEAPGRSARPRHQHYRALDAREKLALCYPRDGCKGRESQRRERESNDRGAGLATGNGWWHACSDMTLRELLAKEISGKLDAMYAGTGRASTPPEWLLKGWLLMGLYSVAASGCSASSSATTCCSAGSGT